MTLYRQVPVSDRLPAKEGRYIVSNGLTWFEACYSYNYSFHEEFTDCSGVVAWLEVVEFPDERQIIESSLEWHTLTTYKDADLGSFRRGVNWLKEKIGI